MIIGPSGRAIERLVKRSTPGSRSRIGRVWCPNDGCLSPGFLGRQSQFEDLGPGGTDLFQQRTGSVLQTVAPANFLDLRSDFRVPVGGQVREEVVFDLV